MNFAGKVAVGPYLYVVGLIQSLYVIHILIFFLRCYFNTSIVHYTKFSRLLRLNLAAVGGQKSLILLCQLLFVVLFVIKYSFNANKRRYLVLCKVYHVTKGLQLTVCWKLVVDPNLKFVSNRKKGLRSQTIPPRPIFWIPRREQVYS